MASPNTITTALCLGHRKGWRHSEFLIPNSEFNPGADLRKSANSGRALMAGFRIIVVLLHRDAHPLEILLEVRFGFAATHAGEIANSD